jgi:hypothetical protein
MARRPCDTPLVMYVCGEENTLSQMLDPIDEIPGK